MIVGSFWTFSPRPYIQKLASTYTWPIKNKLMIVDSKVLAIKGGMKVPSSFKCTLKRNQGMVKHKNQRPTFHSDWRNLEVKKWLGIKHKIIPTQRNQSSSYVRCDHKMLRNYNLKTQENEFSLQVICSPLIFQLQASKSVGLELNSTQLSSALNKFQIPHIQGKHDT